MMITPEESFLSEVTDFQNVLLNISIYFLDSNRLQKKLADADVIFKLYLVGFCNFGWKLKLKLCKSRWDVDLMQFFWEPILI